MVHILKEAREKAGYTIDEVSKILKIRKQYILSIEEGDFHNIPGEVYLKGYTKMYYEFLGVELPKNKEQPVLKKQVTYNKNKLQKNLIAIIGLVFLLIAITTYIVLKEDGTHSIVNHIEFGAVNLASLECAREDCCLRKLRL